MTRVQSQRLKSTVLFVDAENPRTSLFVTERTGILNSRANEISQSGKNQEVHIINGVFSKK